MQKRMFGLAFGRVIGITGLHAAPPVTRPDHLVR